VQDGYQGHGIGTELFTLLARFGWADGVRRFEADSYADNLAMLDIFTRGRPVRRR
jgi:RimJ/RimL family protein N-acetyltransferase